MDSLVIIQSWLPSVVALIAIVWGILEYRNAQKLKRKQILFKLVHEFDYSSEMYLAQRILDDFNVVEYFRERKIKFRHREAYYFASNLKRLLRDHKKIPIEDPGERAIRDSFDALLEFFGKLEYLLEVGLIEKKELLYFQYFLDKCQASDAVMKYVKTYGFPLYRKLQERTSRSK